MRALWEAIKKYWGLLTLAVGFVGGVVLVLFAKSDKRDDETDVDWEEQRRKLDEEHLREIDELRKEEAEKQKNVIAKYDATIAEIQRQYDERQAELDAERKAEIERIIREYGEDPQRVADELASLLPGVTVKKIEDFE